jgi:uncharacterized protein DUF1579
MSLRKSLCLIIMALVWTLSTCVVMAQDQPTEEMMKKWEEAATPGESHKLLNPFIGRWNMKTRAWMQGKDKAPSESTGISDIRWSLDGRFLLQESTGEMMGKPFSGVGYTGYDNFKQKYVFVWMDNSATAMYTGEGTSDPGAQVFTFYGKMDEPMTGEKDKTVKYVTRLVSKDKHVFEIYDQVGTPNEFKVVEITYTRKPSRKSKR